MKQTVVALTLCLLASFGSVETVGAQAAGSITGTVTLEPPPPPRRTASRYPAGGQAAQEVQLTSAVVFLRGQIPGSPAGYVTDPEMMQRDSLFAPSTVALTVGGTVTFPNDDPIFHNVFSYSSVKRFDLGRYPRGESRSVTFDEPGFVEVSCEVHDRMAGVIVVTENPWHAVVGDDGTFSMAGVPPGEYTLVAWHVEHGPEEFEVTVTAGETARVEVELRR